MRPTLSRTEFLAATMLRPATFDQRVKVGEFCFAFGCKRTAHLNEYTWPDVFCFLLTSMAHAFSGLELKRCADVFRDNWKPWLDALVQFEHRPELGEQFVCIAWTDINRGQPPRVLFGDAAEIAAALRPETTAPTFIGMSFVLRLLRNNAKLAGLTPPDKLTVNPKDEVAYEIWHRQIDDHRQAAGERVAKLTKPLTPA